MSWPAHVSEWEIPLWFSGFGFLLNGVLCLWALRLAAKGEKFS